MQKDKRMMRAMAAAGVAGSLALSGCVVAAAEHGQAPPTAGLVRTITYETGPCFGACPVYAVSVSSDGSGRFVGRQHTAVIGERSFRVTQAQFAAFEGQLAPYRPAGERRLATGEECNGRVATDMPSVEVTWAGKGPTSRLYAYYGCDMDRNAAMFEALRSAPQALPIEQFVGRR